MPEPHPQLHLARAPELTPSPTRPEHEERRLLALIARHDLAAFDTLYRCYHPRLLRFLDRMTRRPTLVDELINDTMFVVWSRADRYDGTSKVSTWVFGIAYRSALKALRGLDEPLDDEAVDFCPSDEPGPQRCLELQQMQVRLLAALDALSAEHRAVVELTYFHGADCREIAQIVDCPVATVKTRMFYARRRLKTLLAGQMGDWL